ncbi:transcription elongation factor A protein 3-like isoform X3 [Acipenser ruthenus]|uniref:transcription elongation factor A protein 3-like isoform X3 n=1 Tax=Acipenser ruthenus TaxID=7906 RepID=UPI0027418ACF|nr:transcription elongation factor A protein 3-like isoform X3 [Acipenser ruthenus]
MAREEELIRIAKKLDKMVSRNNMEGALDLLKELKAYKMTLKLLQGTRIGMSVNAVRKHCTDEEVVTLAKILIKNWKRLLMESADAQKRELEKGEGNEKRREEISHSKATSTGGPTQPTKQPDKEASKGDSPDSKSISVSPKKHPGEHKRERKDSTDSKSLPPKQPSLEIKKERKDSTDSKSSPPKRPSLDTKKERKDSTDFKLLPQQRPSLDTKKERKDSTDFKLLPQQRPSLDTKKERKESTDFKSLPQIQPSLNLKKERKDCTDLMLLPQKRPSLDTKKERKDSTDTNSLPPKRPSIDTKKERKDSFDSTSATAIKRPSSDTKAERRNPSDSLFNSTSTPLKKLSLDCKGERRDSHNSKPAISSPPHRKPSSDSREERVNNGKGKVEPPKTPTSPTSPLTPSFSPSGGPFPPHLLTGETIRDKCIEMLSAALKTDDDYKIYGTNCESMAAEIEDHIYQDIKATDMKYKNRVRSRISNLKDPKNPNLRRNVLSRAIELSRIATMTADEMASDELKNLRNVLTQEAIREHQMAKTSGTTTDLLQCGKCKKKNCTYNQVQTRSADEPMTTFVLCNECGNRWKFC